MTTQWFKASNEPKQTVRYTNTLQNERILHRRMNAKDKIRHTYRQTEIKYQLTDLQ